MNTEQLYDLYSNSISHILNSNMLGTISDRSIDIHGYNLINRILIYIQNKYTTSLRSSDGWEAIGRRVKDKNSPIWVLENIIETQYIDPETNEVIKDSGLNAVELDRAVKLGAISKVRSTTGLKSIPVFNVKDTIIVDSEAYKAFTKSEQRGIKVSTLLAMCSKSFGIVCKKSENESTFDSKTKTLFIGSDELVNKVDAISKAVFGTLGIQEILSAAVEEQAIKKKDASKLVQVGNAFLCESLKSFIVDNYEVESTTFDTIDSMDFTEDKLLECFIQIFSIVHDIVEEIICELKPKSHTFSESTLRKAAELLNILEANEALLKLRG